MQRLTRLVKLISILQGGKRFNADHLAAACQVHRRTIFRDLDALKEAGVPLFYDETERAYQLQKQYYLPPTNFTAEEALALIVVCQEMGNQQGVPFYSAAARAAIKLENILPVRLREQVEDIRQAVHIKLPPQTPLEESEPVYQRILAAIASRQPLQVEYQSFHEQTVVYTRIDPYRVLFSRRSWYCIGRSSFHREVRTFNVHRIRKLELLEETYAIPQRFSLERYLRNAWHLIPEEGPDSEIHLQFQPLVAGNVEEVLWHKNQRTERNNDGTLDFFVTVSGLQEISWWILGYGDQVEVIEPPALREMISQAIFRMARIYQSDVPDLNQ
ncbi:WYL domain-containing transcriptional regulator [Planctomycetales bacterium 10988]|nr:WYL domain-containing transcriptional regulator [Planctomycetales bacterium 10988]